MKQNILALDWTNLAFRSLYMANGFNGSATYDNQEEINNYIGKMAMDISYILRMYTPNKVVFCIDSKHSWRKDIIGTYKFNRVKSSEYNWDNIFAALDSFKEHLKKLGFIFAEVEHAEADDMLALVKEITFQEPAFQNYNLVLVSADADIRQLIDFNPITSQYCMVFNEIGTGKGGYRHLYCNESTMQWYNAPIDDQINDIFNFEVDNEREHIKSLLIANPKVKMEVTDPDNILLNKIFCGDDGDCVPAFYEWFNDKGSKKRFTNAPYLKMIELLGVHNIKELDQTKDSLKEAMEKVIKKEINDIDVLARLERQKKLVYLNSEMFPENIAEYKKKLTNDILHQPSLNLYGIKMDTLLKDSEFKDVLVKDKRRDADVFKSLNKYVDNLNLTPLF